MKSKVSFAILLVLLCGYTCSTAGVHRCSKYCSVIMCSDLLGQLCIAPIGLFIFFLRFHLITFRESGKEGERETETSMCERHIDRLPCPQLGTWSATQTCVLTWNQTGGDLSLYRPGLNPLSHTSQGWAIHLCVASIYLYSHIFVTTLNGIFPNSK